VSKVLSELPGPLGGADLLSP